MLSVRREVCLFLLVLSFTSCEASTVNSQAEASTQEAILSDSVRVESLKEMGMTIQVPTDWVPQKEEGITTFTQPCKEAFCTNLVVLQRPYPDNSTLEEIKDYFIESLPKKHKVVQVVNTQSVVIDGHETMIVDYKLYERETHLGASVAFLKRGDQLISFNFMALNQPNGIYAEKRKQFSLAVSSMKF